MYDPLLLLERLGEWASNRRRLRKLRRTVASHLTLGHIDSLESLELIRDRDINVVFDVGANVGTWTLLAKCILPNCEVHAFEPLPFHITEFKKAVANVSGVTLHELALGDSSGCIDIRITSSTDASSVLPLSKLRSSHYDLAEVDTIEVQLDSIDNLMAHRRTPQPDLIKMDIQGYELTALQGANNALRTAKAILLEVSFQAIYEEQCLFHEIVEFLNVRGFRLTSIGHGPIVGRRLVQADLLFERADTAELQS
ncbi:MAG: FkbM family methyltransferase [Planctomycetaceae bacterium]